MAGFLKAILIATITVAAIIIFFNMAFFFPWYMEIIQTTFNISQRISTDNYLAYNYYEDFLNELRERPIFAERAATIRIEAIHVDEARTAIEADGPHDVSGYYYYIDDASSKPYVQMGNLVTITVSANYPFRMQMFGRPINAADIPITFSMTTVTTRHYKDLEYDYGPDGDTFEDYEIDW